MPHLQPDPKTAGFLSLRAIRSASPLRWLVAFVVAAGWFVLSSHCALGMGLVLSHSQCCQNESAQDQHAPHGTAICCKDVQALASGAAKPHELKPDLVGALFAVGWLLESENRNECCESDARGGGTVPPLAFSFSELVLQRSLLAHAPPALL